MVNAIITPDPDAVIAEVQIAAPPERVFQALTSRAQALQWGASDLFEMTVWEMDPRPGGKWQFISRELTGKNAGKEYEHHGEILEIDPPRLLVYTWFADWHEPPSHRTVVRWELTPAAHGTKVKLTHSGLRQLPAACQSYSQGWPGLMQALKNFLEK
ncbi:MAG TPA: SRPBCC domain-containing protein [Terriglobales bacterium]|jgi:uncharacterized protein YndB with AHSA1/START domain|nr:SRPBCC domain-containing protein [Terriglobales bacterium]